MRVIVTRPGDDGARLAAKLTALGHTPILSPLMTIMPLRNVPIPPRPWQAIAATSANAIRALGEAGSLAHIPILTVGPQSEAAAKAAGFESTSAHGGDVSGLAAHIRATMSSEAGPVLYLSGAETSGDLEGRLHAGGFDCTRVILYDAVPATSLGAAAQVLSSLHDLAVMLYSPRTARIWASLAQPHNPAKVMHLCLSSNVAAVLPQHWAKRIAATPTEDAMLALLEP
ncbi:uroporphyrinogen-III synthase [Aestuariivirga sp.]|uniref:uroporphyrinogen-III synthase n=1 Tax=Aestuariivirga sp. TaxID=2650926 RepID=UPI0039E58563